MEKRGTKLTSYRRKWTRNRVPRFPLFSNSVAVVAKKKWWLRKKFPDIKISSSLFGWCLLVFLYFSLFVSLSISFAFLSFPFLSICLFFFFSFWSFHSTPPTGGVASIRGNSVCLFVCLFVCLSVIASTFPLYDVLDHTNHTFSESSWSKDI